MNYRNTTVLAATDVGASGTKDIEIKLRDVISRITIFWRPTKGQNGMDSYLHNDITNIELKANGEVIFGMNGGQAQALNIYDRKCPTMNKGVHINGNQDIATFGIDFGRFLFDPQLALDPKNFDSLILYVTYDENVADTLVEANELEVRADVFDEKVINPVGFLMSKEHDSRTPPASGYDYVKLPTDYPIRKLLLQGYRAQYEPYYQVTELRLDENNEKRIPFDWDLDDYLDAMKGVWLPVTELLQGYTNGTPLYHYVTPTDYWVQAEGMTTKESYPLFYFMVPFRGGYVGVANYEGASISGFVRGYLPNHCFEFPFGNPMDMDDWYNVTPDMSLRSRFKAGSGGASGTVSHILQQLRRY